ncbi:MAG: MBL fold metallo-hydrolase [Candidatus Bathyarchaeia archaeon]|jgi:7,8-dihydropterin-6-yl-methyl-4-(beta-D-ribofuranosyl)aminobenzene 5'-phosphate synthase
MSTTSHGPFNIVEVEGIEVLSLVDNSVDFLSTIDRKEAQSFRQWTKKRHGQEWTRTHFQLPFAEHGFSMLIRVLCRRKTVSILFDTGISADGVVENAKRMGLELSEVEYVVLSHGHYDHFGGLVSALKTINKANLPLIVHEDMFKTRGTPNRDGTIRTYPEFPAREQLSSAQLINTKQPYLIGDGMILVTGEIPRESSFEKGFLQHRTLKDGVWQSDPLILDDRAVVFNVKGKGLVIISGCAHAGIINTISYAQRISGIMNIYAVIGGFHLAGKENESRIGQTAKELARISPKLIVPSHCTGWRGMCTIANVLPEAFVCNSVGNLYEV